MADTVVKDGTKVDAVSAADAAVLASAEAKAAADKAAAEKTAASIAAVKPDFEAEAKRIAALPEAERASAQHALDEAKAKADADAKAATDAAASKTVVPETYDLKVPEGSGVDAAFVERTAAIARELGLDQSGAEKLLSQRANEITDLTKAYQPPDEKGLNAGPLWIARDEALTKEAFADKAFGNNDKATFDTNVEKAQRGLKILDGDAGPLRALLKQHGFGSDVRVLKALAGLADKAGEGKQIPHTSSAGVDGRTAAERMYPSMFKDGKPITAGS